MQKIKSKTKSIEEKVEDYGKSQLSSYGRDFFVKNDTINPEIDNAMKKAPSKSGGVKKIELLKLTAEELEAQSRKIEERIEISLKNLNQSMQDDLQISVGSRVELVTGMIMAGLGVDGKIAPLEISELKGQTGQKTNDGMVIINKISDFLTERELPQEKRDMLVNDLSRVFVHSGLHSPHNGESKLKTVYSKLKSEILPIFTSSHHLDFAGKLFNVLNEWVDIPDCELKVLP